MKSKKPITKYLFVILLFSLTAGYSAALEVNISKDLPSVEVVHNGVPIIIQRIQNKDNHLTGGFTKTSRACPPFCIQPMETAPGVTTVGELEMLQFMQTRLKNGTGIIIDARTRDWHRKGTIPGSVNIPFTTFDHSEYHPQLREAMAKLGVTSKSKTSGLWSEFISSVGLGSKDSSPWDFSKAKDVLLWCNGMWCEQSPRAIQNLLKHKYPAEKIYYYRGGMQAWQILGLTVIVPES
ncbi:MAG: rhodanese-like domain-containing protein [Gammaproteobacteria bacterium]|nr:rhodanese-like domain-containing protein [Gammaproteobacteria bacterium]MDH5651396.1 rhodanese-like domain-containing protein [Gammaproteobacteria bacterium]